MNEKSFIRRVSAKTNRLLESHCNSCGLLVAASPKRRFLEMAERAHICPVYCNYRRKTHASPEENSMLGEAAS
jgi:hypothetical protein